MFASIIRRLADSKRRNALATRLALFRKNYFADVPVDLESLPQFRAEFFPASGPVPWIDRPNALLSIEEMLRDGRLNDSDAAMCRQFSIDGYYIARNLIDSASLDRVWGGYESALANKVVIAPPEKHGADDPYPGRVLDAHLAIPEIRSLLWHPPIIRICNILFGRETVPFQTIIGHKGSRQSPHADAIHMTTYPLGFLLAAWIAVEDIHADSGPLMYFPRSHRLMPHMLSADVGLAMMEYKEKGGQIYAERYERSIQKYLSAFELEAKTFLPKRGDVLFWHSNLVHGGSERTDILRSRKAMVCHYFAQGAFTYHDLSGNASRLHRNGTYADLVKDRP